MTRTPYGVRFLMLRSVPCAFRGFGIQEDITLEIRFCNGTVMQNILYQPFIGNGYVDGMKELTPEQNNALRSCFQ